MLKMDGLLNGWMLPSPLRDQNVLTQMSISTPMSPTTINIAYNTTQVVPYVTLISTQETHILFLQAASRDPPSFLSDQIGGGCVF